jgi:cadmium resistance protein CadD (predicted permease)
VPTLHRPVTLASVSSLPASIGTAVALFAGTNVDDVVVLALLSASSRASGRPARWQIWAGQYAGFAALAGLSLAAGRGLSLVPARWLWLLALLGVAALTIVDGADNVAAYTPVFATSRGAQIAVMLIVFALGVAIWCAAGSLLVRHQRITETLARYGHWILPAAFILIALYTLHQTARVH